MRSTLVLVVCNMRVAPYLVTHKNHVFGDAKAEYGESGFLQKSPLSLRGLDIAATAL